jgi:hypothetical protein
MSRGDRRIHRGSHGDNGCLCRVHEDLRDRSFQGRFFCATVIHVPVRNEIEKELAMNTTVITTTNPATGAITTTTVIHHFHYWLFILAILAVALICSGLRALFWNKDSN